MISSVQNPLVKYIRRLMHKPAFRKAEKRFVAEGRRETERAIKGGYCPEKLVVCPEIDPHTDLMAKVRKACPGTETVEVTSKVYAQMAYRGGTEGVLITAGQKDHRPRWESLPGNPLILIAERIQKPGNIGALLRTTDAVGADAVFFVEPLTDLYNPNVIRSGLGTLFTQKVWTGNLADLARGKEQTGFRLLAATLQNARVYWNEKLTGSLALAVGNEAEGLSDDLRRLADAQIYIPMNGIADSLNVSVSGAILLYEALRQRKS